MAMQIHHIATLECNFIPNLIGIALSVATSPQLLWTFVTSNHLNPNTARQQQRQLQDTEFVFGRGRVADATNTATTLL
jgi:hypothetical protein